MIVDDAHDVSSGVISGKDKENLEPCLLGKSTMPFARPQMLPSAFASFSSPRKRRSAPQHQQQPQQQQHQLATNFASPPAENGRACASGIPWQEVQVPGAPKRDVRRRKRFSSEALGEMDLAESLSVLSIEPPAKRPRIRAGAVEAFCFGSVASPVRLAADIAGGPSSPLFVACPRPVAAAVGFADAAAAPSGGNIFWNETLASMWAGQVEDALLPSTSVDDDDDLMRQTPPARPRSAVCLRLFGGSARRSGASPSPSPLGGSPIGSTPGSSVRRHGSSALVSGASSPRLDDDISPARLFTM